MDDYARVPFKTFKVKCKYCGKKIERNFSKKVNGFTCFKCRKERAKERYYKHKMRMKENKVP